MLLKRKKDVTTQDHYRGKDQRRARSGKEVEHEVDIKEINVSNCTFYKRFKSERMGAQFAHLFWIEATIEARVRLKDFKEHTLPLIDYG